MTDVERPTLDTTYKRADKELIYGEFGWVTDLDFFDDVDEPVELIEEHWHRTSVRRRWALPMMYDCYLGDCDEDANGWYLVEDRPQARCKEHATGLERA